MSDENPIQVHAVMGSIFAVTAAIEYARTGRPKPFGPNYSTNTALALSMLAFIAGVVNFARTGSVSSIAAGLTFCALYLLSFVHLQAGQWHGYEIALLASIVMGIGFLPRIVEVVGRPLPREFCLLGLYGTVIFANAIHFWLGLGLSLSFALLAVGDDALRFFKETRLPLNEPE
ncbi:uncharacterized protein N7482_000481 [Penicillium canariense]|uniref:Uncharacterized protein n=1 Tax=Penicillium canariense TaxID=189055 RepID=A0A9W9LSZ4_9EURO|nr:uncharacterized protein N7482_000481 [Penicillium canariense]KAJ5174604.1 hypothetical protein N7482_000481 [Penicillium canariense]